MQPQLTTSKLQLLPTALFLLCLVMAGFAFETTVSGLFTLWQVYDGNYGHGLLVVLCSLVLILRALHQGPAIPPVPGWYFALPLIVVSSLIALAQTVGVDLLQYLLLPLVILFAFLLVAGVQRTRAILLPLGLIYFAIPFWDYLNNTLVEITSVIVQYFIARTGITAYISGNSIFIPSGEIVIAAGCSGLRYFIIGTFLGVLGGYLNSVSLKRLLMLIATLSGLSLVANWVRVYGITLVAYYSEMQSPLVQDHELLGWVLFMSFMMPPLYLNGRYQPANAGAVDNGSAASATGSLTGLARIRLALAVVLVWLCMSITPYLVSRSANNPNTEPDLDALASFRLDEPTDYVPVQTDWQPKISAPDTSSVSRVGQGSESVVVYRYLYVSNGTQEEIMPYVSNLYDRDNWAIISTGSLEDFTLLELSNKATQEQILVLYQFNVGGFTTTSYLLAKLLQFPAVLRQQPYALFTAATIRCGADCRSAHEVLANIVHDR